MLATMLVLLPGCQAKVVKGSFRLTGENSEAELAKFAFSVGTGKINAKFWTNELYADTRTLKMYFYCDEEWPKALSAPTCEDTVRFARENVALDLMRDGKHESEDAPYMFSLKHTLKQNIRTHYWYFMVADCSLEIYNHQAPKVYFEVSMFNRKGEHLPADEYGMWTMHFLALLVLMCGFAYLIFVQRRKKSSSIHLAFLILYGAFLCAILASFFELIHIWIYCSNGIGFPMLNLLSTFVESYADLLLTFLLISIASGWTLGSAMVPVSSLSRRGEVIHDTFLLGTFIQVMRKPMLLLRRCGSFSSIVFFGLLVGHLFLVMYSCLDTTYGGEDFDQFHDHEHTAGVIILWFRAFLGAVFWAIIGRNISGGVNLSGEMVIFMKRFRFLGGFWLFSMPILVVIASIFAPYLRHPIVTGGTLLAQSSALSFMSWLFCLSKDTIFFRKSTISAGSESLGLGVILEEEEDYEGEIEDRAFPTPAPAYTSTAPGSLTTSKASKRKPALKFFGKRVHAD